jgi:excisionase family DNA binding protein
MPQVTLEQAAVVLGVSVDTVRRRVRLGQLTAHRDPTGRSLVAVPAAPLLPTEIERLSQQDREQLLALRRDNVHLSALVEELRRQQARLEQHSATLREQLAAAIEAQRDLHRLLARAQDQISRLLPVPGAGSHQ